MPVSVLARWDQQEGVVWDSILRKTSRPKPRTRHGHSLTRCGSKWEYLVMFGGMAWNRHSDWHRYDDVAVLRPAQQPSNEHAGSSDNPMTEAESAPGQLAKSLEWFFPEISGPIPEPRGYHASAVSEDGCKVKGALPNRSII
eukprot:scaffold405269_cov19-Prasinocladus_malaysianus.AAC.1